MFLFFGFSFVKRKGFKVFGLYTKNAQALLPEHLYLFPSLEGGVRGRLYFT